MRDDVSVGCNQIWPADGHGEHSGVRSSGPVWRLDATDVMLREHPVRGGQKHHLARTRPKSKHPLLLCLLLHAEFNRQHKQLIIEFR